MYSITIEKSALKNLQKIPKSDQTNIVTAIRNLAFHQRPTGSKKLTGRSGWRLRVGRYRVIYEIKDTNCSILVVDIDHRKDIYR